MSTDLRASLRRIKPEKRLQSLTRRTAAELPFFKNDTSLPNLLYDTTVYIDVLQGDFPDELETALRGSRSWHSSVTEAELVSICGFLNPRNPDTPAAVERITKTIESRTEHSILVPDRETWMDAAIIAATLARLQQRSRVDKVLLLNDSLILETARKHGLTVLTRNIKDFDLLQQLEPSAKVLFYEKQSA